MFLRPVGFDNYSWCPGLGIPTNQCKISGSWRTDSLENERAMATWFRLMLMDETLQIRNLWLYHWIPVKKFSKMVWYETRVKSIVLRQNQFPDNNFTTNIVVNNELTPDISNATCSLSVAASLFEMKLRLMVSRHNNFLCKHKYRITPSTGNVFLLMKWVGTFKFN
jgi:hypothetical protein